MENNKINNKVLTIEDIIAKKEAIKNRKKIKYIYVESEFLGGNLKAHSLDKNTLHYVRDALRKEQDLGMRTFIFMSIDILRDKELLKGYDRHKGDSTLIIDDVFNDGEKAKVIEALTRLNGWDNFSEKDILVHEIDELMGE